MFYDVDSFNLPHENSSNSKKNLVYSVLFCFPRTFYNVTVSLHWFDGNDLVAIFPTIINITSISYAWL